MASSAEDATIEGMSEGSLGEALIPIINRLQDIFSQVSVDISLTLPQVAVVGSQSSGKSSVLESLVGRDFLPRGSDIVTRRPLLLQLIKSSGRAPPASPGQSRGTGPAVTEWGEFLHAPGKLFYDFNHIREEIQAETDRVVGTNRNVSDKPIRLKIFSPHVLTMTLVDLPGMTKVPVGDQPSNIESQIREMVLSYIANPLAIILAVSPANADLANSDAIQLAREVDPEGLRTIGVLTKLDIMDRGTNAAHILRGQLIPLRMGYTAVINRCQEDINMGISVEAARRREEQFFAERTEYRDMTARCGLVALSRRINSLLALHIKEQLPNLNRTIRLDLEGKMAELRALGQPLAPDSRSARGAFLLSLLCEYSERFSAMLDGRHQDFSTQRLTGGARIRAIFTDGFGHEVRETAPMHEISDDIILTILKNGAGVGGNLLVAHEPFEVLVRQCVEALREPSLTCNQAVHQELLEIARMSCPKGLNRFPALNRALHGAVNEFIKSGADPAEKMIKGLLDCELDFINVDHPDFIGARGAIRAVMQERSARGARKVDSPDVGRDVGAVAIAVREPTHPLANAKQGKAVVPLAAHAPHAANGQANGAMVGFGGAGLKALPEQSAHSNDELLSRTGRRSDNAMGWTSPDESLRLGAGLPAPTSPSSAAWNAQGQGAASASSGSWFGFLRPNGSARPGGEAPSRGPATAFGQQLDRGRGGQHAQQQQAPPRTDHECVDIEVVRRLVDSYFSIVRRNLADAVPKAIMHYMVNHTKKGLQTNLIQQLYKDELLDELLSEQDGVVRQRVALQESITALQEAAAALDQVPEALIQCGQGGLTSGGGVESKVLMMTVTDGAMQASPLGLDRYSLYQSADSRPVSSVPVSYGQVATALDRSPSMTAAARVASAATASLSGNFSSA